MLTKDQIFGAAPVLPREEVKAFGGAVLVQGLTALQRDEFEASCLVQEGRGQRLNIVGMRAKLVCRCVIDQNGKRIFEDGDALRIGQLPARDVERVFEAAQRLSGISETDLRELEKNSASGPADGSSSV